MSLPKIILTAILCCGFVSCGIFAPREDFELPVSDERIGDPFNFASLLDGSGEQFSKLDWYELFDDKFEYVNVRLANIVYDKSALISRLFLQHDIFPGVAVTWVNNEGILITIDMITLRNVSYAVAMKETPETPLYSGNSGFIIVRGNDNIWRIRSWTDEPSGEAFFSPAAE
ncbi:MAG: hypothetical protein JXA18_12345 [Chitinispirillaceae bacterium]|nr:hypothetical protein [Chitinispirillaceae bacterium]